MQVTRRGVEMTVRVEKYNGRRVAHHAQVIEGAQGDVGASGKLWVDFAVDMVRTEVD